MPIIDERESAWLAKYAISSASSTGRRFSEPPHAYRGPFQRDRDRVLHSAAFRRLSQKTQVFTGHQLGDYHRTRLTHTLEGTSIARTVGRVLQLNEDLIEALMLMHDIGHPPFGHAGEDALDESLHAHGGFNHNAQALRIVEELERRTKSYPGLNLCNETLAGQRARATKHEKETPVSLEVQVVDAADSIAYDSHDPDDALHYRFVTLKELDAAPMWKLARERVTSRFTDMSDNEIRYATVHELIDWQVSDLVSQTIENLAARRIQTVEDVFKAGRIVEPSAEMQELKRGLERFLLEQLYQHPRIMSSRKEYQAKLQQLFDYYCNHADQMPNSFQARIAQSSLQRTVGDYLSGMTDRFAVQEFEKLG